MIAYNSIQICRYDMEYKKIKEINEYKSESINPMKTPDTMYELYSVPFFTTGHPEYLHGSEIGSSKVTVQKNDILVCKINPRINRVWVVADESNYQSIASSEWIIVRTAQYNPYFLAWYFRTPMFQQLMTSEVTGIGGSLTRAQPKRVVEYPVPVLSREKQDKIVSILDRLESIKRERKSELDLLDSLVKARFVEMFGSQRKSCDLSSYIHELRSGKSLAGSEVCKNKVLKTGAATFGWFDPNQYKYLPNDYQPLPEHRVETGDLMISRMNTPNLVGACSYVFKAPEDMYYPDRLWKVIPTEKTNLIFLWQLLWDDEVRRQIKEKASGTSGTMHNISKARLLKVKCIDVPIEIQNQYANDVVHVVKSKVAIDHGVILIRKALQSGYHNVWGN